MLGSLILYLGSGHIGCPVVSCVFRILTGWGGGGLNSVRPWHILSSGQFRAGGMMIKILATDGMMLLKSNVKIMMMLMLLIKTMMMLMLLLMILLIVKMQLVCVMS